MPDSPSTKPAVDSIIVDDPPAPGTDEWMKIMSASKVPAALGVSRWQSPFALWHEMKGTVPKQEFEEGRGDWGHIAERSLAAWWLHENPGFQLNQRDGVQGSAEIAYSNPALSFANIATLDRRAIDRTKSPRTPHADRFHIVECKTAFDMSDWGYPEDGVEGVPADYYSQVLFQMGVAGIHHASIVVLGRGMPEIFNIPWDPERFAAIIDRLDDFMRSLDADEPPELDNTVATYETVRGLHPDIDREQVIEVDLEVAERVLDAARSVDLSKAAERAAKIELADLMGNARQAYVNGVKVADRRSKKGGTPYVQINKKADITATTN